jgi:hypothetical protein
MIQSISGMGGGMMGMQGARGGGGPEKAFNKMDADGDGALSATEMQKMSDMMAEKMGTDAQSVEDMMTQMDSDGDGALSFAEFESGRSIGMQQGGAAGMMSATMGYGKNQMDLSSLFNSSDEESEKEEESIYAYA